MFKYLPKSYADLLLTMGVLRVGTLHDFRRQEHGRGIADVDEGRKAVRHTINHLTVRDVTDPQFRTSVHARAMEAFRAIRIGPGVRNVTLKNVRFTQHIDVPDCFIYCTSSLNSRAVLAEFAGAQTCVEIIDPQRYFKTITEALDAHTPVVFRGIFEVKYADREERWNGQDWGDHPAMIKPPSYRQQRELRAIWQPRRKDPIKPVNIGHMDLPRFCRRVALQA